MWNFDSDKAGEVPADGSGRRRLAGIPDPHPSKPNTFACLPAVLLKSLTMRSSITQWQSRRHPTEYADFTLEAQSKSAGGRFDCSEASSSATL